MKEIRLHELHLLNWRGAKDRTANFGNCTITNITGHNGRGKSTFFDAFIWLLYGKDQFGRKDFKITPVEDKEVLNRLDSVVTATLSVDGVMVNLSRTLHPKWTRKAGSKEQTFTGYETQFEMDGVPCRQKDYNAKVDEIIDSVVFAMISDPHYFLKMKWKDQRDILFAIAGTVSDEDLAAKDHNFAALIERVSGKSMEEYRKKVAAEKKRLNEDLKQIPAKIDQTRFLMPETPAEGWQHLEDELKQIDNRIQDYDTAIGSAVAKNNVEYNAQKALLDEINALRRKSQEIKTAKENAYIDERNVMNITERQRHAEVNRKRADLIAKRDQLENQRDAARKELAHCQNMIKIEADKLDRALKEKEALLAKWKEIKNRQFTTAAECVMCPVFAGKICKDPDAADRVAETNKKAKEAFAAKLSEDLAEVNATGKSKAEWIEGVKNSIVKYKKAIDEGQAKIEDLAKKIDATKAEIEENPEVPLKWHATEPPADFFDNDEELKGIDKQIADLEKRTSEPAAHCDTTELQSGKHNAMTRRDEVVKLLAGRDQIEKGKEAIANLEEESKRLSQEIANIEKEEFLIADFVREKISECESRINGRFKYVDWKLFDYTLEGGEVETCQALNKANGTPIDTTNTADVLNCGIDIVNTLSEFYGITAPIFIDRRESVCDLIETNAQIINLIVVKGEDLKITNI